VAIDAAIAVAPHLPEFQWMRGRLLETMERSDDARTAYLKAAEDPLDHSYELTSRLAMVRLAANRKDYPDAIAQCRKAIALDPTNADSIANLGSLLAANGDEKSGRLEYLHALGPNVGFSDQRLMIATVIRYLQLAINAPLQGSEILTAHELAKQLTTKVNGDVSARFLLRAVELVQGDASARADIEKMLGQAREAKADRFAEEIEKFLRAHPAAK
jgi:tetratricopeptide (TPR) repeat protein